MIGIYKFVGDDQYKSAFDATELRLARSSGPRRDRPYPELVEVGEAVG